MFGFLKKLFGGDTKPEVKSDLVWGQPAPYKIEPLQEKIEPEVTTTAPVEAPVASFPFPKPIEEPKPVESKKPKAKKAAKPKTTDSKTSKPRKPRAEKKAASK